MREKTLSEIWKEVQEKYKLGLEASLNQGSSEPLVLTMEQTALDLQNNYGIDLKKLLNLTPEQIESYKDIQLGEKKPEPKITFNWKPYAFIVGGGVAAILILKLIK